MKRRIARNSQHKIPLKTQKASVISFFYAASKCPTRSKNHLTSLDFFPSMLVWSMSAVPSSKCNSIVHEIPQTLFGLYKATEHKWTYMLCVCVCVDTDTKKKTEDVIVI